MLALPNPEQSRSRKVLQIDNDWITNEGWYTDCGEWDTEGKEWTTEEEQESEFSDLETDCSISDISLPRAAF